MDSVHCKLLLPEGPIPAWPASTLGAEHVRAWGLQGPIREERRSEYRLARPRQLPRHSPCSTHRGTERDRPVRSSHSCSQVGWLSGATGFLERAACACSSPSPRVSQPLLSPEQHLSASSLGLVALHSPRDNQMSFESRKHTTHVACLLLILQFSGCAYHSAGTVLSATSTLTPIILTATLQVRFYFHTIPILQMKKPRSPEGKVLAPNHREVRAKPQI